MPILKNKTLKLVNFGSIRARRTMPHDFGKYLIKSDTGQKTFYNCNKRMKNRNKGKEKAGYMSRARISTLRFNLKFQDKT